jgi:hypothetical protein
MKAIPRWALLACTAVVLALPSCETDGNFTVLGYTTKPNYDCSIHTVRVPIFQNRTFRQGVEFDLTRAVVREIEAKTPYKVVGADSNADTELTGTIISFTKGTLNVNPLNEIRDQETDLVVEVTWRDLRTGEFLSAPGNRANGGPASALLALPGAAPVTDVPGVLAPAITSAPMAPNSGAATFVQPVQTVGPDGAPAPPVVLGPGGTPLPPVLCGPDGKPRPPNYGKVTLTSSGDFIPELGQSITTAQKQNVDRMAVQITSMMEKPW